MPFADADGVRIRIHHLGGTGPPMVCVHATGFHGRVWEPFVPRLREHYTILSLDQRGHGESAKPANGYEWVHFGGDVLAVLDEMGLEEPVGIGHSAGAAALVFAETERPGSFSKLVLMDPVTPVPQIGQVMGVSDNPMSEQAKRRRAVWDTHEQMIERLRKGGSPLADWREEFLRAYVTYGLEPGEDGKLHLRCPPEIEAQIYVMGGRHDGWDRLAEIACPTLFLAGAESYMWAEELRVEAAQKLQKGRVETSPGGHFFPMEQPEAALDRVLTFLEGS
jgi:pimeloyl-ACP methyl ester carboxylesterase